MSKKQTKRTKEQPVSKTKRIAISRVRAGMKIMLHSGKEDEILSVRKPRAKLDGYGLDTQRTRATGGSAYHYGQRSKVTVVL